MDLTWEGVGPAVAEPNQFIRHGARVMFDTQRLAQMGSWSGTLNVAGNDLKVDPATTWGSRDRSWGVRPVGEKEPDGIRQGANVMGGGMWSYFPMRFEDHSIYYICSERADGVRTLEQAERVWLDGRIEQLGRTEHAHEFEPGIRLLTGSTISFPDAGFEIRVHAAAGQFPRRRHRLRPRGRLAPRHVPGSRSRHAGHRLRGAGDPPARRVRRRRPCRPFRVRRAHRLRPLRALVQRCDAAVRAGVAVAPDDGTAAQKPAMPLPMRTIPIRKSNTAITVALLATSQPSRDSSTGCARLP